MAITLPIKLPAFVVLLKLNAVLLVPRLNISNVLAPALYVFPMRHLPILAFENAV